MQEDGKAPSKSKKKDSGDDDGDDDEPDEPEAKEEVMKRTRGENAENFAGDDTEFYAVVMFGSRPERETFMTHCGARPEDRYIDGEAVLEKMGAEFAEAVHAARPVPVPKPEKKSKKKA